MLHYEGVGLKLVFISKRKKKIIEKCMRKMFVILTQISAFFLDQKDNDFLPIP